MTSLSGVISQFGGSGNVPNNMRSYLKLGAFSGWYGGVAEHDNNNLIPSSGSLSLSNFASPANKDFVSDNYTTGFSSYVDFNIPYYEYAWGYSTTDGLSAASLNFLTGQGSPGGRTLVGKATYGSSGQEATVTGVYDYDIDGQVQGFIFQLLGDQRRSGWGGTGTSPGTSGAAPTSISILSSTLSFGSATVPNGTYNSTYNITTWDWSTQVGLFNLPATFTFSVSIF
jgi:hypothetical protein